MFNQMDDDGNESVDMEEYMNWWSKVKGNGKPVEQFAAQLERLLDKVAFLNQVDSIPEHFVQNSAEPLTVDKKQAVKQY